MIVVMNAVTIMVAAAIRSIIAAVVATNGAYTTEVLDEATNVLKLIVENKTHGVIEEALYDLCKKHDLDTRTGGDVGDLLLLAAYAMEKLVCAKKVALAEKNVAFLHEEMFNVMVVLNQNTDMLSTGLSEEEMALVVH